jgi:hypothetical protein
MHVQANRHGRGGATLARLVVAAAALVAVAPAALAQQDDARTILKAMADYVSAQQTIEIKFDSDIEIITPELEKIQFTNSGEVMLSRPDKLAAHRVGGYADVALYFDGKTASVYGKNVNGYAQIAAAGTLDQLFEALRAGHGVALPGADFLVSKPYETLIADVLEAKHIGRGVIDGVECEHLAFRNFETDWQLWVEVGDKAIPRKVVITSKTINGAPQYTFRVKSWRTGFQPAPDTFKFTPPANATRLDPNNLIMLDELPPEAPAGGNP